MVHFCNAINIVILNLSLLSHSEPVSVSSVRMVSPFSLSVVLLYDRRLMYCCMSAVSCLVLLVVGDIMPSSCLQPLFLSIAFPIHISLAQSIHSSRFKIDGATPFQSGVKLTKDHESPQVDTTFYHWLVGSLIYLTHSWPNISFSISVVSFFMQNIKDSH